MADQVGASAVEHPETQIKVEFVRGGFGVETLEGAEAAFRPDDDNTRQIKTIRRWFQLQARADLTSVSFKHSTISL